MAFSQIGYYVVIYQAQHQQKEYIKELVCQNLAENLLTVIDYTTNDKNIFWEEEGKEFFFKGDIYDLVKTKTVHGRIYFYCINDEKENELIKNYNNITKNNSSTDKKAKNTFEKSFSPFLLIQLYFISPIKISATTYPYTNSNIETCNGDTALKPPQV